MSVYIYCGPSISKREAQQWLEAVYLPPVSQGDIVSLLREKPRVIGIIDGYFDLVPAVWHKEILLALSQGVHVVGAASMGALRAAELYPFGMVGIGEIFEWYRDGVIEADDEVAVRHAPAELEYRPVNEALVNIRKTLQLAQEEGVVSEATAAKLIDLGRQIPYWERRYERLFKQGKLAGIAKEQVADLQLFVEEKAVNLKQADALALLNYIAQLPEDLPPFEPAFDLQETVFLRRLIDRDRTVYEVGEVWLTAEELTHHARLEAADFLALKERATLNTLILDFAKQLGLVVSEEGLEAEKEKLGFTTPEEIAQWCANNHLTAAEFEQFLQEAALIHKMKEAYTTEVLNGELLRQMRLEGVYEEMAEMTMNKKRALLEGYRPPEGEAADVLAAYFARIGRVVPEDLQSYWAALGFESGAAFVLELEKNHVYHQRHTDALNC